MTKKKVSPKLGERHFQMLCAIAEYQEESLSSVAAEGLRRYLESEYRNAHPALRVLFDKHLGLTLPQQQQNGSNGGMRQTYLIQ